MRNHESSINVVGFFFQQLGGYLSLIEQTSQICIELSSAKPLENNTLCSD